jgi:hypothetical protein
LLDIDRLIGSDIADMVPLPAAANA